MRTPEHQPRVALAGVPNVGKTTVFNQLTGLRALCVQPRGGKKTVNLFFRFEGNWAALREKCRAALDGFSPISNGPGNLFQNPNFAS